MKIDLSKNKLKELPLNFGDLRNLRHLDLYSNEVLPPHNIVTRGSQRANLISIFYSCKDFLSAFIS